MAYLDCLWLLPDLNSLFLLERRENKSQTRQQVYCERNRIKEDRRI